MPQAVVQVARQPLAFTQRRQFGISLTGYFKGTLGRLQLGNEPGTLPADVAHMPRIGENPRKYSPYDGGLYDHLARQTRHVPAADQPEEHTAEHWGGRDSQARRHEEMHLTQIHHTQAVEMAVQAPFDQPQAQASQEIA